jgi:hypothetical protein
LGRRRLRPLVLGTAAVVALAVAGCGEKSEPSVHPPATTAVTATTPTATVPEPTTTQPGPKTTP